MSVSFRNRTLLFTGTGKGKTTAALGMAVRASGHGLRSLMVQFVKSNDTTGEMAALRHLPGIQIIQVGRGFPPVHDGPEFSAHRRAAEAGLKSVAEALASGSWDMVILDEIANAVFRGFLEEPQVIDAVQKAAPKTVVVLTGRHASDRLVELADTVTEMRPLKHGFERGWTAQQGVEF